VILPKWDDSLTLPPTFDEYMQEQPVAAGSRQEKQD
jgi:general secretion pathway protein D